MAYSKKQRRDYTQVVIQTQKMKERSKLNLCSLSVHTKMNLLSNEMWTNGSHHNSINGQESRLAHAISIS
jgi:hypothetical protein